MDTTPIPRLVAANEQLPRPVDGSRAEPAAGGRVRFDYVKRCALAGAINGAISAYEGAVTLAPDFAHAHSNLGSVYLHIGRRDDALRAYETAIKADPNLAPIHYNLATVLLDLGRHDEAITALETAAGLAPSLYDIHVNLGRAYRRGGRHREALLPALRAIDLRPDRDAYLQLGAVALGLDAFDAALVANRRALELDPTCASARTSVDRIRAMLDGMQGAAGIASNTVP